MYKEPVRSGPRYMHVPLACSQTVTWAGGRVRPTPLLPL